MSRKINLLGKKGTALALIDGDILIYQVCCDLLEEVEEDGEFTWKLDRGDAQRSILNRIDTLRREVAASDAIVAVGSQSNWRKRITPTYKSNRAGRKKPLGYRALIDWLRTKHDVRSYPMLEADDVLGLIHTDPRHAKRPTVIVSCDKDMLTLPGKLFNPDVPLMSEVSAFQADVNHYIRALAGDSSDGYKGCAGLGEKRANDLLSKCKKSDLWPTVLTAFLEGGHDEAYAIEQCRLARVLRHGEYDVKTGKLKLWTPPTKKAG